MSNFRPRNSKIYKDLLLHDNLGKSKPTDDFAILARARTLTAVRGLDPDRKGLLIQFLYEAHLIGFINNESKPQPTIIPLISAFLNNANLEGTYLRGIDLRGAFLNDTNLSDADLAYASMGCVMFGVPISNAQLGQCTLFENVDLTGANLSEVDASYTDFMDANFDQAILTDAKFANGYGSISQKQLDQSKSCTSAILPPKLVCHKKS